MQIKVSTLTGYKLNCLDGETGESKEFYFDDVTWCIRYMAVNIPGKIGYHVLLPVEALGTPDQIRHVFPVQLTMEQVRSSPVIDIDNPVSRQQEYALHEHYAWPVYWSGGFYDPSGISMMPDLAYDVEVSAGRLSDGVRKLDPNLRSIRELADCSVHATDGRIGHVEDVLVDNENWIIRYLVVNTRNWLPERLVLVSPQWMKRVSWADRDVFVDLTREAVKKSPKYVSAQVVGSEYDRKLSEHYQKNAFTEWVVFKFDAPPGTDVYVAGTFNGWDPTSLKLGDNGKGTYTGTVLLPLGRYEYKFIVDGDWRNAPNGGKQVPNAFGTMNSVLVVGRTATKDAHLHTFARQPHNDNRPMWSTPMGG
jgi:hypothetical protein